MSQAEENNHCVLLLPIPSRFLGKCPFLAFVCPLECWGIQVGEGIRTKCFASTPKRTEGRGRDWTKSPEPVWCIG